MHYLSRSYSALVGNLQLFSPYEAGYIFTNWSATLGEAGSTDYGRGEPMYTAFMAYLDSERFYFGPNSASEGRYPSYKEGAIPIKLTAHYKAGTVSFKVDWALEGTENPAEIVLTVSDNEISSGSPYLTGFADGSVTPPQKKGYYFAGWQLTAEVFNETGDMFFRCLCNGCEEGCDCEQENCCGDLYSYHTGFLEVLNQHLDLGAFTATAKAVWKPISFTVQYVAGEGEAYKTEPSDYAKLLTANAWALEGERLPAFRRDEYLTGFTLAIADGEGESVASDADLFEKLRTYLEKLDSFSETAAAGVSVTLTAQWAPRTIEITIDYDDNAGDKSVTEKTASEFFEGEGERLPAFHEKNGYGFLEGEQDWQINGEGKYRYEDEAINAIVDAYLKQYSGDVRSAKLTFIFTPIRTEKEITVNFTGADWLEEGARTKVYSYSEIAGGEFRLPAHNGYYVLWESAFSNDDAVLYTFTTSTYKDGAQTFTGSLDDELQRLLLGYLDRGGNATAYETKFSLKEHTAREIALSYETENGTAVAKETLSYADLLGDAPQYAFRMSMRAGYYLSAWTWEEGKHTLSRSAAIEELASLLMQYADEVNASETLNISLKANWTEREIVIRYDPQGGKDIPEERYSYSGLNNWKDEYAAREQSVYTTHAGYYFASWASEAGSLQRGANADSAIAALRTYADGQDLAEVTVTLSATWQEKKIKISYSGLSGVSGGPSGSTINYFSSFTLPGAGSKTGYNFTNYSFNNKTYSANANPISDLRSYADTKDETTISVTFTEQWKINSYKITINSSGNKGGSISGVVDGGMYEYNTNISVTISYYGNKNSYYVRDGNNLGDVSSDTFDMPAHDVALEVHSDYEEPPDPDWCYSDGTMIYMADGTKKPIETLSVGDMVLAVNHYTGQIEARPIALTAHYEEAAKAYEILNLTFSNGTVLKIIHEHALFDLTKNKYVAISVDNVESYLGDTFAYVAQDAFGEYIYESVTLKSYFVTKEWTGRYAVVSMGAWNVIAEGLVSTVSFQGFVEFINIFEYGDGLKYDEQKMQADIDRYGLFTYEEMQGAIPKEVFDAFNVQYFKVAIGKGILDPDLMAELFEKYHQYV